MARFATMEPSVATMIQRNDLDLRGMAAKEGWVILQRQVALARTTLPARCNGNTCYLVVDIAVRCDPPPVDLKPLEYQRAS